MRRDGEIPNVHDGIAAIIVVEYEGTFDLCWLWPGERVGSAGDETGACIIYAPTGDRRVNIGDLIEVAALLDEEDERDA